MSFKNFCKSVIWNQPVLCFLGSMTQFNFKMLLSGPLSFVPSLNTIGLRGTVMSGEKLPADYYDSVFLRHLVKAHQYGAKTISKVVAEIGPGDALGLGLMALLTGSERYYAFDIVKYAENGENLKVLKELIALLRHRTDIPDDRVWPLVEPYLSDYKFPHPILTEDRLNESLHPDRLARIESALSEMSAKTTRDISISYVVPWSSHEMIKENSVDLIISQAVLEHVDNPSVAYEVMYRWLSPNGLISHAIDFRSHGLSKKWNGHWAYPKFLWQLMRGRRPFLLNRDPQSSHIQFARK